MRALVLALLASACDPNSDVTPMPDARAVDAAVGPMDAPYTCTPLAPAERAPAADCLVLAPSTLQGMTPFGTVDVALDYFGAGDCITISQARIHWTGACGEQLAVSFSYPVTSDGAARSVTHSFDTDVRFEFQPPGMAMRTHVTTVHVDVVRWQEGQGMHDIDITVTVTDARYAIAPLRVVGTFCDWPYYVC